MAKQRRDSRGRFVARAVKKSPPKKRRQPAPRGLSLGERIMLSQGAYAQAMALANEREARLTEEQRRLEAEERLAIVLGEAEAREEELARMREQLEPDRRINEPDVDYARRLVREAKENGLDLEYHYRRIADISGASPRQVYTLWVSPGALDAA